MTTTLIALISISIGILGAALTGIFFREKTFDFTGNTMAGTFGSIFFIKSFARLGFDPVSIMASGEVDISLLSINFIVSFFGGVLGVFLLKRLEIWMKKGVVSGDEKG